MIQGRSGLRLLDEAAATLIFVARSVDQNLYRHKSIQAWVLGFVDVAHAAGDEFFENRIVAYGTSDQTISVSQIGRMESIPAKCFNEVRTLLPLS
jgi:hypothetical protein